MITFKQYLTELAPATHGAKNHTGPGSDTQAGANKAKTASAPAKAEPARTMTPAKPTRPNQDKPSSTLKDKTNADKLERRLKGQNIKYTKTVDKNGTKFEFDDDRSKKNADRLASTTVDKTKEDPDEAA